MKELGNPPETGFFTRPKEIRHLLRTPGGGLNNRLALHLAPFLVVAAWSLPTFDVYIPFVLCHCHSTDVSPLVSCCSSV